MSLAEIAERFSRFCRTGELDPSFQVNPKRAQIYFRHVKTGIESALRRAYPLTYHLLKPKRWNQLVDAFLAEADCATPFLWRMPQFLVDFVKKNEWGHRFNLPYLDDLVDFEWLEIEIYMMPDCSEKRIRRKASLLDNPLVVNPESRIAIYSYPVFEKKKLPRPMKKGTYPLLTFRHPDYQQVHFIALSPFFKTVMDHLQSQCSTGRAALASAAKQFNFKEEQVMAAGEHFLNDMFEQLAIYGIREHSN